ncbi:MAG: cytochrome c oxidase accessory protein CcoG [Bradymonadia bacterium]
MPLQGNDTVTTIGQSGSRVWLYPLLVAGRYVKARRVVGWALIVFLLIAPWVDINGHPAMMFDLPNRRFYFWGLSLFATDATYLLFLCGLIVFGVFLFTALFGRIWCGWSCPQTVFMELVIRPIEQLVEGKPSARKKLDKAPWGPSKIFKKSLKWAAFLVVSGALSTTLVAYFLGRDGIVEAQLDPWSHPVGTSIFIFFTGLFFFDFAWFREQTCIVVCPYGRLQSVLMDQDSLTINYDAGRGEPRGKPKKKADGTPLGDCIDCRKCVQVCPTGIDIRKGVQMECVNCAVCIDACDEMMDKIGRPRGLIRYTSEAQLAGKPRRFARPRTLAYTVALTAVIVAMSVTLVTRQPIEMIMTRQVGAPYLTLPDGRVQNMTNLNIANKTRETRHLKVRALTEGGEVIVPGKALVLKPEALINVPVFLIQPDPKEPDGEGVFSIEITDDQGFKQVMTYPFLSKPDAARASKAATRKEKGA